MGMNNIKNIFTKILMVGVMLMLVVMPCFADNGCENDDNDMISAEFALCSTHAYNIGEIENPESGDRELMRDVIAMKTEIVTQQMYRHYQQMESMLKRFKTQLKKAVLSADLQAAGAKKDDDDDNDTYVSKDMNIFIAGIQDCNSMMDSLKRAECFNTNYQTIYNTSGNGSTPSASGVKKQLAKDFEIVCAELGKDCATPKINEKNIECNTNSLGKKANFQQCLNTHRTNINKLYEKARTQNAGWNTPKWGYAG
jgi:hypothetical protein